MIQARFDCKNGIFPPAERIRSKQRTDVWVSSLRFSFGVVSVLLLLVSCFPFCCRRLGVNFYSQSGVFSHKGHRRRLSSHDDRIPNDRVLYIVTSLAEFDNGRRATVEGYDRFSNTIVPVVRESVTSMLKAGYNVDVFLVAHYNVSTSRYEELTSQLPFSVGFQVWEDATPLGYSLENSQDHIMPHTRGLSRQHRYVIKDKFFHYDLFVCFEDDMLIRGAHIEHFTNLTDTLYRMRQTAASTLPDMTVTTEQATDIFFGPMTKQQLSRTIPGFMRVEAALTDFLPTKHNRFEQIPVDFVWQQDDASHSSIDPSVCCHVARETANSHIPLAPKEDELYFWEMSIDAMGVRKMPAPQLDWVLLLGGNKNEVWGNPAYVIGDYWSGRSKYFGNKSRPDRSQGQYINNQGGWMGTRRQIAEWHMRWCRGGLLPPYDLPHYRFDGLDQRSVEYWSGGIQLVGVNSCNLQRIVTLDPAGFSRHLIYHTSNNKQRSKRAKRQFSGRSINEFWGQLNTIRKKAEAEMLNELSNESTQEDSE